jgi:diguanylate cyclase (GGDEF)-like protein
LNELQVVLVVDDDASNISILAHLLEAEYDVVFATNGSEALELARATPPDLILLDVMMPGMDGYEVCRQLKASTITANIPVIFITGLDEHKAESRGLELGAVDYVTKPFNVGVVRARVRTHIDLKQAHDALISLAATDGLTGLANRRRFDDALAVECKRLARMQEHLALIMIDIDHFKTFNDTYGHLSGDDCLRRVARVFASAMQRASDTAARYGGEEFACILPETTLSGATEVADRIQAGVADLAIEHSASPLARHVTISIGVASLRCISATLPTDLIRAADDCLYRAKQNGRNRVVASSFHDGGLHRESS